MIGVHYQEIQIVNKMREKCKDFAEELAAYVFHPNRLLRFGNTYGIEFDEMLEIY